jgi:Periplasmic binding protein
MQLSSRRAVAALAVMVLVTGCSGGSDSEPVATGGGNGSATTPPTSTADTQAPATTGGTDTTAAPTSDDPMAVFPSLGAPTGDEVVLGLVNTEGVPGLDFPDIRIGIQASADYLNQHGGLGGRPIRLETCVSKGAPESSQACAQELVGKGVEVVLLGLDLFPDYATFKAAGVPVVGVLPVLPPDYSADALFLTGGNATTMAAVARVAKEHFDAKSVGIVSADNPGANSSETALTQALDKVGIAHTTVKGGDNETDAGFQGLMREASKDDPDLLVSLYSDAGCIGTMRGRASMGIQIPVITTGICSSRDVLAEVGDDAVGWHFVGVQADQTSAPQQIMHEVMAPALGVSPDEVDNTALGLGALGVYEMMSLGLYAHMMEQAGTAVTGTALYEFLKGSTDLKLWPGGAPIACGSAAAYPSVCSFSFPFAMYEAGGNVVPMEGLQAVSSAEYLP